MINFNIRGALLLKGITNPVQWLRKRGVSKDLAENLVSGKKKSTPHHIIEMVCYDLYLTPNELYVWSRDRKYPFKENHPLLQIESSLEMPNLDYLVQKLGVDALRKAEKFMKQLQQEEIEARKKIIEEKRKKKG